MLYRHNILTLSQNLYTIREAMVSARKPVHSNITLTYLLTWSTERYTPQRTAFEALLNAKGAEGPFQRFAQAFSALIKDSQERHAAGAYALIVQRMGVVLVATSD